MKKIQPLNRRPSLSFARAIDNSASLHKRPSTVTESPSHCARETAQEYLKKSSLFPKELDKSNAGESNIPKKEKSEKDSLSNKVAKECPKLHSSSLEDILNGEVIDEYLECMYITSVYIVNNYVGTRVTNTEEPGKILEFANQLFPLSSKAKVECIKKAKTITLPEYALNVIIVEAEDLIPTDTDGFSDPFCKVWMNKAKESTKETSVKEHTLHPYWNESFLLPLKDLEKDVLHIEIWDKDSASIRANLREMRNIRGFRGFCFFCRECCHNTCCFRLGTIDDFVGKIDLPVKEINSVGFDEVKDLHSMKGESIGGRLHFVAQFRVLRPTHILDGLKRHLLLFKMILRQSLSQFNSSNVSINRWEQILSPAAVSLTFQHSLQSSLNSAEDAMCRFIVFIHLTRNKYCTDFSFLFSLMDYTFECMQQLLSIDYGLESSLEDLYKMTVDGVYNACISVLETFHSFDLSDELKGLELEFVLKCIRVCRNVLDKDLLWTALQSEAVSWFQQLGDKVQNIDAKIRPHFIRTTIDFIITFHSAADKVVTKVFPDKSYTYFISDILNSKLEESFRTHISRISEESTTVFGEVKTKKVKDALDIFTKMKELNEYIYETLDVTESGQQIENFREWFGSAAIEEWFDCKQELIVQNIKEIVSSDNLENKVIECAGRLEKQSLSVIQTINVIQTELVHLWNLVSHSQYPEYDYIFLEALHLTCMKYAECLLDLVHSENIVSNFRTYGKLKLCVMANNLWSLAMFVKKTITDTVANVPLECHDTKFCLKLMCYIICSDMSKELESDIVEDIKKVVSAGSKKKQIIAINSYVNKINHLLTKEAMNFMAFEVYLLFLREIWKSIIKAVRFFKDEHKDSDVPTSLNICQRIFYEKPSITAGLLSVLTETEKFCFIDAQGKLKRYMWTEDFRVLKNELQQLVVG